MNRGCHAGVRAGPPALPPASASASAARPGEEEDEEGMDEPPEVKQFLQELGEGGRAAQEPGLPEDGLPASGACLACFVACSASLSSNAVWKMTESGSHWHVYFVAIPSEDCVLRGMHTPGCSLEVEQRHPGWVLRPVCCAKADVSVLAKAQCSRLHLCGCMSMSQQCMQS